MKAAIHQPHYMPWLGYLRKMKEADVFVYMDNTQFIKRSFINRNRIQIDGKDHWLTIPVKTKGKYASQMIKDVEVNWEKEWTTNHQRTLSYNYSNGSGDKLVKFYSFKGEMIIDWCIRSVEFLRQAFGIDISIIFESDLDVKGVSTERLVNICEIVGADTYLSGISGRNYMDESKFGDIKLEYMDWKPPGHLSALHYYLTNDLGVLP